MKPGLALDAYVRILSQLADETEADAPVESGESYQRGLAHGIAMGLRQAAKIARAELLS